MMESPVTATEITATEITATEITATEITAAEIGMVPPTRAEEESAHPAPTRRRRACRTGSARVPPRPPEPSRQDAATVAETLGRIDASVAPGLSGIDAPYALHLQVMTETPFWCHAPALHCLMHELLAICAAGLGRDREDGRTDARIDVAVACDGGWVFVQIADTGPGLDLAILADMETGERGELRWSGDAGAPLARAIDAADALRGELRLLCSGPEGTRFAIGFPDAARLTEAFPADARGRDARSTQQAACDDALEVGVP